LSNSIDFNKERIVLASTLIHKSRVYENEEVIAIRKRAKVQFVIQVDMA